MAINLAKFALFEANSRLKVDSVLHEEVLILITALRVHSLMVEEILHKAVDSVVIRVPKVLLSAIDLVYNFFAVQVIED
jgi:hypothetical protein